MAGHVFILRADLTGLSCDAWLMPTDYRLHIRDHWFKGFPWLRKTWKPGPASEDWENRKSRVMEVSDWPIEVPKPWLVNTGAGPWASPAWYAEGVIEFFDKVAPLVKKKGKYFGNRAKPLLALPLVGTGAGGGAERAGIILKHLLPVLYNAAEQYDIDIALTTISGPAYAAAINERKIVETCGKIIWPAEITQKYRKKTEGLAEFVRNGSLVLFLGAGVSAGAGLPTWSELLKSLAEKAEVFPVGESENGELEKAFSALGHLDQARLISASFGQKNKDAMVNVVSELIKKHHHFSLSHAILAGIGVKEVVTTNYDSLYEKASKSAMGEKIPVLPYDSPEPEKPWILKLHGCVERPQDMVLTRSDYLRYNERRAALKGIVQALLITRHMLFVGFSLTDDNFHGIIEDVRKAVRGDPDHRKSIGMNDIPFGTALIPKRNLFMEQLWHDDLDCVNFQGTGENKGSAYRLQEIFLDCLASLSSSSTAHLLDPRYAGVLTESEATICSALRKMISNMDEKAKEAPAWLEIEQLIKRFGG